MMYLLDTNICVALIRRKSQEVLDHIIQQRPGTIGVSSITVAELHYGAAKSAKPAQNMAALEQLLLPFDLLDFDHAAALTYGRIRATLERQGTPIGAMDLLIAAHGLSTDRIVVTHNTSEFSRVPGLHIEDWLTPLP